MQASLFIIGLFIAFVVQPYRSGRVASATSPDGIQCAVIQKWNGWGGEWYTVSLYARRPGGPWRWHYVDHEASRWKSCKIEFSEDGTQVFTGGGDGKRRTFLLSEGDKQGQAPPYLPPEMEDKR